MTGFLSGVFLLFIAVGMPIGFVLGVTGLFGMIKTGIPSVLQLVPQRYFAGVDMFTLMAMPFFILAGEIMNKAGITRRLVKFSNVLVGHLQGGLAHANIVASVFFAGITGAAVSDTAAIGSMLIPAMVDEGYDKDFSAAVTAASSIIGPTIPPSNIMVIYGAFMQVSIAGLFLTGFLPGLILAGAEMLLTARIAKKRGYPVGERRATLKEIWLAFKEAAVALLMPAIILGGILSGMFTPTEAAAVAVAYAFFLGFFVYKNITLKDMWPLFMKMARTTGVVFLVIAAASILGWVLTMEQIPEKVATMMLSVSTNKWIIMSMILLLLLFIGMFMDIAAALIILGPILHPLAVSLGFHPLHFGIIMVLSLNIALMTPPVGACLFVACGISKLTIEQLSREILPYIFVALIVLLVITFIPDIPLFLPRLMGLAN
ncbi:MAG: TRAP transporter large permease [Aminobacterium sp.]|jgi:tripartite ATP-independent transporter DctM subunit|uniref:TRAP transporter large permease n=1 Tax=unclassified Aminobacterium TaxID=2685012 RepID=UPI001BCA78A2|nr:MULTISPECIES: TRAP transporter large permease [unclassified Aminobacterium]MDD2206657.1 TRAP transporter large permease [Aminobacterium sp.]MDD3706779.1 TRAP transporter large permease [Aminobacterium sp.]MDD4228596.1 TRAP transporter large permease [Aminobacterium sp.]MDD4551524.1 TRAP transporter large permease [Aminobacterium sp.]MEA4877816.1 TRAP transporter large permease [Aminobacterium sp.]